MNAAPDIARLAGDLIRLGRIASVDAAAATCRVQVGDIVTGAIPWLSFRAGETASFSAPSVGEQCLLLSPEGDVELGVALPGLFSTAFPAPTVDADRHVIRFKDLAWLGYDQAGHELKITLPAGATIAIEATGGIHVTGDIDLTGKLTASDDVVAAGKSLKGHKHGGVQAGSAQTQAPA